jgi:hypothetical protein
MKTVYPVRVTYDFTVEISHSQKDTAKEILTLAGDKYRYCLTHMGEPMPLIPKVEVGTVSLRDDETLTTKEDEEVMTLARLINDLSIFRMNDKSFFYWETSDTDSLQCNSGKYCGIFNTAREALEDYHQYLLKNRIYTRLEPMTF